MAHIKHLSYSCPQRHRNDYDLGFADHNIQNLYSHSVDNLQHSATDFMLLATFLTQVYTLCSPFC
jgi:hypothetical protein